MYMELPCVSRAVHGGAHRRNDHGLRLETTSAVAATPLWMVGAMLVPARKKPSRAQTRAWVIFSPPVLRKITASTSSSSTTEMETAIALTSLRRRTGIAAFGGQCGGMRGPSGRMAGRPYG